MDSKAHIDLLQKMARNWLELRRAIDVLSESQMTRTGTVGEWSVKDTLAHIAAWDRVNIERIEAVGRGEPRREFTVDQIEELNRAAVEEAAEYELQDILEDLDETHQELMALLEESPAVSLKAMRKAAWEHYSEHAAEFRAIGRSSNGRKADH